MKTCSLQSGSNGNAIYVEAGGVRLLFDAGISARQARQRLATHNRQMRLVDAVILSHAHSDHTRCAGIFQRMFGMPLYATHGTLEVILPYQGRLSDVRPFSAGAALDFGDVCVRSIPTPHDAADSVAFVVEHKDVRLGVFTDLGHPFGGLATALAEVDAAYLESNYDPRMLAEGSYPAALQARIRGRGGHLSNGESAAMVKACTNGRLRWIALAHLSAENNTPEIAMSTHRAALGDEWVLEMTSRYEVSPMLAL